MLSEWKSASLAFLLWYIHKHIHNENKKFVLNHQPRMVNAKSIRCHLSRSHVYSLSEKYWRIGITLIISGCLCVCVCSWDGNRGNANYLVAIYHVIICLFLLHSFSMPTIFFFLLCSNHFCISLIIFIAVEPFFWHGVIAFWMIIVHFSIIILWEAAVWRTLNANCRNNSVFPIYHSLTINVVQFKWFHSNFS